MLDHQCSPAAGVVLNTVLPSWVVTLSLICLLSYLTKRTLATGLRLRAQEELLLVHHSMPSRQPDLQAGMDVDGASVEGVDGREGSSCQEAGLCKRVEMGGGQMGSHMEATTLAGRWVEPAYSDKPSPALPSRTLLRSTSIKAQEEHSMQSRVECLARRDLPAVVVSAQPPAALGQDRDPAAGKLPPSSPDAVISVIGTAHLPTTAPLEPLPCPFQTSMLLGPPTAYQHPQRAQRGDNPTPHTHLSPSSPGCTGQGPGSLELEPGSLELEECLMMQVRGRRG